MQEPLPPIPFEVVPIIPEPEAVELPFDSAWLQWRLAEGLWEAQVRAEAAAP